MTRFDAGKDCDSCGGLLVPTQVIANISVPPRTDYVCMKCGRPYRWVGNPPRLLTISRVVRTEPSDDD